MDSIGYYGFLARNLPPRRLARAAGLRLWRQTALPILPVPTGISAAELLHSFGVESAAALPARLAAPLEGPLAFRSPSAAQESARWILRHLPAEAEEASALAERSLARRIVVFGREVDLPPTEAEVPLASRGWIGIDWEADPIVTGERPQLVRRMDGGAGRLRGTAARGARGDAGGEVELIRAKGARGRSTSDRGSGRGRGRGSASGSRQGRDRDQRKSPPGDSAGSGAWIGGDGAGLPADGSRIPAGKDPKRQWIVGRLEEVVHLACGALLSLPDDPARAEALVDAALDRMVDFAQAPKGIQWTCTMEVALRAANMAIGLRLLAGHHRLADRAVALQEILRSLALHLAWIPRHLEDTGVVANNHLVANWVGMLAVSSLFPGLPGAHLAARRASKGLADELMAQTLPDGFGFEGSVPYHGLAVELFLLGDLFATTAGLPLPEPVRRRLSLAFAATAELLDGRGLAPRIGDDDSGRAIPFTQRGSLDLGWLASTGAAHFGRPDPEQGPPCIEQIWLLGPPSYSVRGWKGGGAQTSVAMAAFPREGPPAGAMYEFRERAGDPTDSAEPPPRMNKIPRKPHRDSALRHGGIYLLRSRRLSVAIACGPNGTGGLGTHGHNDKLAVEICVDGTLVVGDPGSGSYSGDPDLRNRLRGTAAHSTVQIDGAEQQPLPLGRLFALPDHALPRCVGFESSPDRARFVGEHQGYLRMGAIHRRVVALDRAAETIEIVDRVTGKGTHSAECRFLIPARTGQPRLLEEEQGRWVVEIHASGDQRPIARLIPEPGSPRPTLEPAWYASGYDQVEAATAVVFERGGPLPLVFRTTIEPHRTAVQR